MPLQTTLVPEWPQLAWLAHGRVGSQAFHVRHGAGVDANPDFVCEAVWDGPFRDGGFDLTDNVFGSGVRDRGDRTLFVSSCGSNDRVCSAQVGDEVWISNSLPCVMQAISADAEPSRRDYPELLEGAVLGLGRYPTHIPTTRDPVRVTYHHNLAWDGRSLSESPKPWPDRPLVTFDDYFAFIDSTIAAFARNMADPARVVRRTFLGTMSSGYDSTTCAALLRPHGLREAISFASARGGDDDSGAEVAKVLDIEVTTFRRDAFRAIPFSETRFLASEAKGEDVYFAAAAPMLRDRVLVTGYYGDTMWGKQTTVLTDTITRPGGGSGMSHTEARLHAGYIHMSPPFLAVRDVRKVHAISNREDMLPWSVGGKYDRPICRRIVEGLGVPREAFGQEKKMVSVLFGFGFADMSEAGRTDFDAWRRANVAPTPRDAVVRNLARVRGRAFRSPRLARMVRSLEGPYGHPRMLPLVGGLIDDVRRSSLGLEQRNELYRWANPLVKKSYATTPGSAQA